MSKRKEKPRSPAQLVNWEDLPSPYRKPIHVRWRKHVRQFVNKEIMPNIDKWEKQLDVPSEFYRKCYEAGLYSHNYPKEYGGTPFEDSATGISKDGNIKAADPFLTIILYEEIAKVGSGGLIGAGWIHYVAVAPVLLFGSDFLKEEMRAGYVYIFPFNSSLHIQYMHLLNISQ